MMINEYNEKKIIKFCINIVNLYSYKNNMVRIYIKNWNEIYFYVIYFIFIFN